MQSRGWGGLNHVQKVAETLGPGPPEIRDGDVEGWVLAFHKSMLVVSSLCKGCFWAFSLPVESSVCVFGGGVGGEGALCFAPL